MDISSRQKIKKETLILKTFDQTEYIYIYRERERERENILCKSTDYTFLSNVHGTFSRVNHILTTKMATY